MNYGNGFTFSDLYTIPTHLRNFYYKKLVESKEKESEQIKKANQSTKSPNVPKVRIKR